MSLVFIVCVCLAYWQLQRGHNKLKMQEQLDSSLITQTKNLSSFNNLPPKFTSITTSGFFLPDLQFLLDNQIYQKQPGFVILTPFVTMDNKIILINRGFSPAKTDRALANPEDLNTPSEQCHITGIIYPPSHGLVLNNNHWGDANWPKVIQGINWDKIISALQDKLSSSQTILPLVVHLTPKSEYSLKLTIAPNIGIPAVRHYGYAVQWLSLALLALGYLGFHIWKRRENYFL